MKRYIGFFGRIELPVTTTPKEVTMDRNNSITPEREKGQHLRFEDRCSIKTCRKLKLSLRKTVEVVGCVASTVLNELRRGTGTRSGNSGRFPEYSAKGGQTNYEIKPLSMLQRQ